MRWAPLALLLATTPAAASEPTTDECLTSSERGQRERDDGHYVQARRSFATCSNGVCPSVVQRDCTQWLLDIDTNVPTMVFVVRDATGSDLGDVVVRMDGSVLATHLDGKPVAVDPGEHAFTFESGTRRIERRAIVNVGEKNRLMQVAIVDDEPKKGRTPTGGWVLGAVGVISFATATLFWVGARNDLASIESSPCASTRTCSSDDVQSVKRRLVAGDVFAGIGVVAVGAAVWILLTHDSGR